MLEFTKWMAGADDISIAHWPRNCWLGVTCENQQRFNERWSIAQDIPASVLFVSGEPLLGPIDFTSYTKMPDWFIVGGESGPGARPMKLEWVENIVGQCQSAGVPVFVKQLHINGKLSKNMDAWPEELRVREYPESRNGREWNELPEDKPLEFSTPI